MHYFGAHTSIAGGLKQAAVRAHELGANAFALFTKNQNRWFSPPLKEEEILLFKETTQSLGFQKEQILPHDSYLINLGNPDEEKRKKSIDSFSDELERVRQLGLGKLNFHPGSHLKEISIEEELTLIARSLDLAMERVAIVHPVLETTAGQGSNVGWRFEEIRDIIAQSSYPERLGVCIDTCHSHAAGYEMRTEEGYGRMMEEFGKIIGFSKLEGMHLNDAKSGFASHVDRHAPLGKGTIGLSLFSMIAKDERTAGIPLILETPDETLWKEEIAWLKSQATDIPRICR